ncbi:hypothetical protein MB02_15785, partial [Croceicoccus estronivorus]|uniref:beta strand repeat-containing protein n=1 Tax=Croceicoccus estronivorus TaxID=1172626 RepID=UPI00082C7F85
FANGDGAASFAGTAALANQQSNFQVNISALNSEAQIGVEVVDSNAGDLPGSTVAVDSNRVAAAAYGNQVNQSLALDAAVVDMLSAGVDLSGGTGLGGNNISADGNLIVTSLQTQYSSNVSADETSLIRILTDADTTVASTLAVTDNTQEAVALGSSGSNGLSLSGTTLGTGAGIVSVQTVDYDSAVSASSGGFAAVEALDVSGSTLEVSDNLQRAIAYGGSANNALAIDGETLTVDDTISPVASIVIYDSGATDGFVLDSTTLPQVLAAYGLLNVQSVGAGITATTVSTGAMSVNADNVSDGANVINESNAFVAAAYGTDAMNSAALDIGTLDTSAGGFASVVNLTNAQTATDDSSILARATGGDVIVTTVDGDATNSGVATSTNTVQVLAYGNRVGNDVTVSGTDIDTAVSGTPRGQAAVSSDQLAISDASFGLNNVQAAAGTITASLLTDDITPAAAGIATYVTGNVEGASIVSDGNTLSAGGTGNRADNLIDLSANTLASTSALSSFQVSGANVVSEIGAEGSDDQPFSYTYFYNGGSAGACDLTSCEPGSLYIAIGITGTPSDNTLTPDQIAYLLDNGWTFESAGPYSAYRHTVTSGSVPLNWNGGIFSADATLPGTPNDGGVVVSIGEDLTASTVSVDDNAIAGSVTGNNAANRLTASGTTIDDGSGFSGASAQVIFPNTVAITADHSLTNRQVVNVGGDLQSDVYGAFVIDMADSADIDGSTLTVDGNTQSSRAVANTATNNLDLSANELSAGSALASFQTSYGTVTAFSDLDVIAPAAMLNSSVSISDNTNLAVGVVNNATNTGSVSATNIDPVDGTASNADLYTNSLGFYANADHGMLNVQFSYYAVSADASTQLYNDDYRSTNTDSSENSSMTMTGNSTAAEATSNRSANTLSVDAASSLGASAGIQNAQAHNSGSVVATATTSASLTLQGDFTSPTAALNGGSALLGSNSTSALARGNAASNALNYSAGADYGSAPAGPAQVSSTAGFGNASSRAQASVLNIQYSSSPVTASSTDASYLVALNGTTGNAATSATVGVIGNSVSAAGYGNTASNAVAVAALNTGMPTAAIGSRQINASAVNAAVTTVSFGITSGVGAVAGSALSVTGNQTTATAAGNNVASAITPGL